MNSIGIVVCGTTIVLAYVADPISASQLLKTGVYTTGLTFVISKVTATRDGSASDFINVAGYSLAGIAGLKLLYLAVSSFDPMFNAIDKIVLACNKISIFLDKITFWN